MTRPTNKDPNQAKDRRQLLSFEYLFLRCPRYGPATRTQYFLSVSLSLAEDFHGTTFEVAIFEKRTQFRPSLPSSAEPDPRPETWQIPEEDNRNLKKPHRIEAQLTRLVEDGPEE